MKLLNLGCGQRYHPDWINVDFNSSGQKVMAHDLNHKLPFADNSFDVVYHSHLLEHFPKHHTPIFLKECYRVLKERGIIRVVVPDFEQIAKLYVALLEKAAEGDEKAQRRYEWIMLEMFDQMVRNKPGGEMLDYWKQNPMPAEDFVIERVGSEVLNALAVLRSTPVLADAPGSGGSAVHTDSLTPLQIGEFRMAGEVHQWMYDRYSLKTLLQNAGFINIKKCRADDSSIPDFNGYLLDIEAEGSVRKPDSLYLEAIKP